MALRFSSILHNTVWIILYCLNGIFNSNPHIRNHPLDMMCCMLCYTDFYILVHHKHNGGDAYHHPMRTTLARRIRSHRVASLCVARNQLINVDAKRSSYIIRGAIQQCPRARQAGPPASAIRLIKQHAAHINIHRAQPSRHERHRSRRHTSGWHSVRIAYYYIHTLT